MAVVLHLGVLAGSAQTYTRRLLFGSALVSGILVQCSRCAIHVMNKQMLDLLAGAKTVSVDLAVFRHVKPCP